MISTSGSLKHIIFIPLCEQFVRPIIIQFIAAHMDSNCITCMLHKTCSDAVTNTAITHTLTQRQTDNIIILFSRRT